MDIREHGIIVDKKKGRVVCNYCGKEMQGYYRLKRHLGGIGPDIAFCDNVTLNIREAFSNMVRKEASVSRFGREVGVSLEVDIQDLLSKKGQKRIARFFYENGLDFSAAESPSFKEMLLAKIVGDDHMEVKFPEIQDLKGWMLQEELEEVQDYVRRVKDSWEITGCSLLLDAWVDHDGRDLAAFVVDSPAGPVYLASYDVSDMKSNLTDLLSLVDAIIEEVGVKRVIQVIACSTSGWVGEVSNSFASNNTRCFWSVSLSHCIELMLERIGNLDSSTEILDNSSCIAEFIRKDSSALQHFRDYGCEIDITGSSSEYDFVKPYLILESIFNAKDVVMALFASKESITICNLVNDSSFWECVERVVKSTSPLIQGLLMFSGVNNQHVGDIYDTMDEIKENIAKKLNNEELCYKPIWEVIDEVWNKHLHSPLHVAGYFLNPSEFYSTDFVSDPEVTTGLITCIFRLIKDWEIGARISEQLVMYTQGKSCFDEASQVDQYNGILPADWWAKKVSGHPELQNFAIKILSQTCVGASRYKLKRSLAEKLLFTKGMSHREKQNLEELAYVHYNLHLQSCKAKLISEEQ